ncbi:MAG TPA: DUF5658 family protein [Fimbriiglobus sp.]|jgi:dipeptide/tripeptide permease
MRRVCIYGLILFAVLSVGDLAYTYLLLECTGGSVYEANPVAAGWLADHGWPGMVAFKAGAAFVVIGAVALIVRYRPALGAAVACMACLATGAVNLHSHRLLAASELHPTPATEMLYNSNPVGE